MFIGCGNDRQFASLAKVLGKPEWATDERFATNSQRVAHREELLRLMGLALDAHTTSEWLGKLHGQGIPFAPINNIEQTFAHPQAIAREVTVEMDHPRAGKVKLLGPAISYGGQKM